MMPAVPYVPDELTPQQGRALKGLENRLAKAEQEREAARQAFAEWVRRTGLHKVARAMGVSPSSLNQRLRLYEGKRRGEGSR